MFIQSFRKAALATSAALVLTVALVMAQDVDPILKITRPSTQKQLSSPSPSAQIERADAFKRLLSDSGARVQRRSFERARPEGQARKLRMPRVWQAASASTQSFGTGGGDINEIEPNDRIAQGVSLPVNVFGEISVDEDLDYFAFQALGGQLVTVEAFAARFRGSELIADIALFDADGRLIVSAAGDEDEDPILRYRSPRDQVLIAGVADLDDFGGSRFDYLLNITRGIDQNENEPNDSRSQVLTDLPVTVFGDIEGRSDLDFFSFIGTAGDSLIVDLDAAVLGSRLDADVNLLDADSGLELFYNDQHDGDDPRFNIVLPHTGRYIIGLGSFDSQSSGFYRLNLSLVSGSGAPIITQVTRIAKKLVEVRGTGLSAFSTVEVNGVARTTTTIDATTLRARAKTKTGSIVTVVNPPDDRRSNPLLVQ